MHLAEELPGGLEGVYLLLKVEELLLLLEALVELEEGALAQSPFPMV